MRTKLATCLAVLILAGVGLRNELPTATATPAPVASVSHKATPKPVVRPDGKTPASARRLAQQMVASRGWNRGTEWRCLFRLWQRESGWRHNADNKASSAYGIPQLLNLPEGTAPAKQIERGLRYVIHRYGTPCEAYAHQRQRGWY
jgi:hypothetical protein